MYVFPLILALYHPFCTPKVQPTVSPVEARMAEFWEPPKDIASRDLYYGPWGRERAPDP